MKKYSFAAKVDAFTWKKNKNTIAAWEGDGKEEWKLYHNISAVQMRYLRKNEIGKIIVPICGGNSLNTAFL